MLNVAIRRTILALSMLVAAMPLARADLPPSPAIGASEDHSVIRISAPDGYCAFNPNDPASVNIKTGFQPGVDHATSLLALYVPCPALDATRETLKGWLPEWLAYESNYIVFPDVEDPSDPVRMQSRPTAYNSVAQLCIAAQTNHPRVDGDTFAAQVAAAHRLLSIDRPVIYIGVVGDDPGACFLSQLRLESGGPGDFKRLLTVTAFMQAAGKWVYQSVRVHAPDASMAAAALLRSKATAQAFIEANR